MKANSTSHREYTPEPGLLAIHLLQAMTSAHREGRRCTLDGLVSELGIRRGDVRSALSSLHREGLIDVLRMRLTFAGFAIGQALTAERLLSLRVEGEAAVQAA
jgi:DNA-binding GntR family transcriptional regulator